MNVAHLLVSQARQRPEALALIEPGHRGDRTLSFSGLDDGSARCAQFLRDADLKSGDHVLVFVPMSIDLYLALIAIFRIGAIATFLDPAAGADHINRCCDLVKPAAMIAVSKAHLLRFTSAALRRIPRKFTVGMPIPGTRRWESAVASPAMPDIEYCADQDAALVTFTSGSTGHPKGAMRSHGFLTAQHASLCQAIALMPGEIDLSTLAIFSLANLASGVTTVIPDADLRHPGRILAAPVLRQIQKYNINRCVASPAFFERLIDDSNARGSLRSLTRIYTGGAPVFPSLLDRLHQMMPQAQAVAIYGSTEAEPIADLAWSDISAEDRQAMLGGAGLLAGIPVPDIDLRIVKDQWGIPLQPIQHSELDQNCLAAGQIGEIIVHGRHVLGGYLGGIGNEATKWRVENQIWHRTGDAGCLDSNGRLWLQGRAEAKIVDSRGTVYPFAVECAASQVKGVARSALIQRNSQRWLIVQALQGAGESMEKVLLDNLAWAGIEKVLRIARMPLDKRHNAKIDYPALRHLLRKT